VTDPIAGVEEDTLFQSERYGNYRYEVPVSDATYSVVLHFAELYHTTTGVRSFSVTVEGQSVLSDFDLFGEVGHDTAHTVTVPNIAVTDKKLTIELTAVADNATISGFAIYSRDGGAFEEPPE